MRVAFSLDGTPVELEGPAEQMLVDGLRDLGRKSVRRTCGIGICGTCTVLLDGEPASGCLLLTAQVEGRVVETAEGLPADDPVVHAFDEQHAFQCGWCTPGMVLTTKALLAGHGGPPDREKIAEALGGNLCRCGCYSKILDAAAQAARKAA